MEFKFKERVELHRPKLEQNVEVEKLYPLLQQYKALAVDDIALIQALPTKQSRVGKLLDILLAKDSAALQSLYLALQKMYQHILTEMFIEPQFTAREVQESCSTPLTSDSEDDGSRSQISTEARHMDFLNRPKTTKIIPSHHYDPNSTMSSSFPTFSSEHPSPLSLHGVRSSGGGGGQESPVLTSPPSDMSSMSMSMSMSKGSGVPASSDKAYGWFFKQFECAFNELKVLKQQNADTMDKYDQVSKEAEHLRAMYKAKAQGLQQVTTELQNVKSQQSDLLLEKTQLLDEIAGLQKLRNEDKMELSDLRHQQRMAFSEENNAASGISEMYAAALDKYENMRKDFDVLREQYAELAASRSTAMSRLDNLSEDNASLIGQMEEMRAKNEALSLERNGLKQQCTNAIREWNQTLIKHGQAKEKLNMVVKQRDDFCKDFNQTFAKYTELKKNYEGLRAEKDAAVKEYAMVMSERDTVHKEIEQLQDKLGSVSKHADVLAKEKKDVDKELETLRQDMSAVLSERDKYRRERNDISGINQGLMNEQLEYRMRLEQQRDMARKECNEAYDHMDQFLKEKQKEKDEEMDHAVKETDALKKQIEKLKMDLENIEQEADNANKNRDKAYSERDKIVQERESIRTLCDNLRRDRDRAVSDLAQALRDSDEFKRQKNEAVKELKEIKSRYEAMVEKDSRRHQLHCVGHNHSRDSAIDADLQDIGAEAIEIPLELDVLEPGNFGFEVMGGKDEPQFSNDPSIIVSNVSKSGPADGKLKVNDTLLRINGVDTFNMEKRTALQALRNSSGVLNLYVRRRKSTSARIWQPVQIVLSCQKDPGIQLDQGLFISRISPGGMVAKYGVMPCVGDRIININNIPVDSLSPSDAMKVLETASDCLVLDVWRQSSPFSSAGSSPTPNSTGINSPLPDGMTTSSGSMSKSDTLAIRSSSWDTNTSPISSGNDASRVGGGSSSSSSKNLRHSGSQVDSLDSLGPSPRKGLGGGGGGGNSHDHESKTRHSMPMLDKAKEKVEKMFRSRNKSQERIAGGTNSKESEEKRHDGKKEFRHSHPLGLASHKSGKNSSSGGQQNSSSNKGVEDCATQVNLSNMDASTTASFENFPPSGSNGNVNSNNTNSNNKLIATNADARASKFSSRKREFELDSNCGTWPKTRGGQQQQHQQQNHPHTNNNNNPQVPSTVISKPSKERPSVKDLFFNNNNNNNNNKNNSNNKTNNSDSVFSNGDGNTITDSFERTMVNPVNQSVVCHSSQNSDTSVKYSGGVGTLGFPSSSSSNQQQSSSSTSASAFTPTSHSTVVSSNNSNQQQQQQLLSSTAPPSSSAVVIATIPPLQPPPTTTATLSSPSSPAAIPISSSTTKSHPQTQSSHFTVGILHGPNIPTATINPHMMPSRAPPVYVKPSPGQQLYGTMSSHKHAASNRGSLISSHQSHGHLGSSTLPHELRREHGHRGAPKVSQIKGRRPATSTPHRPSDKHWQTTPPPPVNWPPPPSAVANRMSSESPIGAGGGFTPVHSTGGGVIVSGASPSLGPSPNTVTGGGGAISPSLPVGVVSPGSGGVMSQSYTMGSLMRPSSLEVPLPSSSSMKASSSEFSVDMPDRHRISSPIVTQSLSSSSGIIGGSNSTSSGRAHHQHHHHHQQYQQNHPSSHHHQQHHQHYQHHPPPPHYQTTSLTSPSSSQYPTLSSPPGTFPVIRSVDLELDRPLSFHGPPTDRYSSPSLISQKSYSTIERCTPTIGDDTSSLRYPRTSPHGRSFFDDDCGRPTAFSSKRERDKMLEMYYGSGMAPALGGGINPAKSGSVEIVSDRSSSGSPMFHIDCRGSLKYKMSPNSDEYIYRRNIPNHHETRDITFEKTSKPFGFQIQRGPSGGIFVSSVNEHSPAAQAGLVIGDQLLEVCGINMRNAFYDVAVTVLRQCGDNLTMKVQYNPEKYIDQQDTSSTLSITSSSLALSPTHSNNPTITPSSNSDKSTPKHIPSPSRPMSSQGSSSSDSGQMGRRFINLKKSNPNMLGAGFSFVGGNAVGIFIHEIYHDCFVEGGHLLQRGDHILEFNSVDFRSLTAEKAMMELNRPCANIALCVVYNFAKYNKIYNMPCDSFYIRSNFDRVSDTEGELSFSKEAVMYVENSLYKNQLGMWFAWLVDQQGNKVKGGVIPSRIRLEDELVLRRTHSESWSIHESEDLKGSRRGSQSARRSFFRKKRHHRNNSKDSHEFGSSFSDASLNSDSVPILDDSIHGYTQVEKIELKSIRPVVILAPLSEALINKLVSESPDKYAYCEPVLMRASAATMDQSLLEGVLVDYWKEGDAYQCVRASAIKQICHNNLHCLLHVTPAAIERMHQAKLYPITVFVKHKKPKEIRDVRDPQFLKDRASHKSAKEQFEQFQRMEQDYRHLFSAVIPGGNLAEMSMHIKSSITAEQGKAIWITSHTM